MCVFKRCHRTNDEIFIKELNKARIGDDSCIDFFNRHAKREKDDEGIVICSVNKRAKSINEEELDKINSKKKNKAKIEGEVKAGDRATDEELGLKVGRES